MGAENHSEVKVTFHKGLITIDEPYGSKVPEAGLFHEAFDMMPTMADSINEAINNDTEARTALSLIKHDQQALHDGIFASNKYVLAAVIKIALKLLVARLYTEDRDEIVHNITDDAINMFARKFGEDPSQMRYILEQNVKGMNKMNESTVSHAMSLILGSVVAQHPDKNKNNDNKKED